MTINKSKNDRRSEESVFTRFISNIFSNACGAGSLASAVSPWASNPIRHVFGMSAAPRAVQPAYARTPERHYT